MKILLVKMSSMGDVFHSFPALNDAAKAIPDLEVDWVVEKAFAEIPAWHPNVKKVFPIELRAWRKHPFKNRKRIRDFFALINEHQYDLILDAQGLLKSVWVAKKVAKKINVPIVGMDWFSAREALASLFYQNKVSVPKNQHAITRQRQLFAQALRYDLQENSQIEYGLTIQDDGLLNQLNMKPQQYVVCLHGTTWETKLWPEDYWVELVKQLLDAGLKVILPWGSPEEQQRSLKIKKAAQNTPSPLTENSIYVPAERHSLTEMAVLLKNAKHVVSVDTGLSHVAAALDVPMTVLYRVTDPELVGAKGSLVQYLVSPLASEYIKNFASGEEEESLINLKVENVLKQMASEVEDNLG